MILCLTPNPALDRTLSVPELRLGEVHRADRVIMAAGGKGLNVARAIRTLGGQPLCMGPIGGHTGNLLADLAHREGLPAQWTAVRHETRTCIILAQPEREATVINDPGQAIEADECRALIEAVWQQAAYANLVCTCGSLPPGFALNQFASLLTGLIARGKAVWVDTSGEALKTALTVRGLSIKVNAAELGEVLGLEISDSKSAVLAARQLRAMGIVHAILTLGKAGAVLNSPAGAWLAQPPALKIVSSVGSGDAFLGGLLAGFDAGLPLEQAFRHATAAGAANTLTLGGGLFSRADFEALHQRIALHALPPP